MINVAINGFGTVGKRIADAVSLQDDMRIVGVTKSKPDYWAQCALQKGFPLFTHKDVAAFSSAGMHVEGTLHDLLKKADVVIDCSPKNGEENKKIYDQFPKLKVIYQGGEKHSLTNLSFVAQCNFEKIVGRSSVRVVSCNTTAMCRALNTLDAKFGVSAVDAVLIRRSVDPHDSGKGLLNGIIPDVRTPTHHGVDVQSVIGPIAVHTMAVVVPTTLMHLQALTVTMKNAVSVDDVLHALGNNPRLLLLNSKDGFKSTSDIMEFAKELDCHRADMHQNVIWKDSISTIGNVVRFYQAVHQEADIVPENIDAIRALFGSCSKEVSMTKTDKTLGIGKKKIFVQPPMLISR